MPWQARRSETVAFDLIAPNRRACIDGCDELLFNLATLAGVPGPTIEHLWQKFYDGPRFTADESKALASELRALHQVMVANPEIIQLAWETQPRHTARTMLARPQGRLRLSAWSWLRCARTVCTAVRGYAVSATERPMDGRRCRSPVEQLRKRRKNGRTSLVLLR